MFLVNHSNTFGEALWRLQGILVGLARVSVRWEVEIFKLFAFCVDLGLISPSEFGI
jgi:hypothetical protein